jgi:hypothetical protein
MHLPKKILEIKLAAPPPTTSSYCPVMPVPVQQHQHIQTNSMPTATEHANSNSKCQQQHALPWQGAGSIFGVKRRRSLSAGASTTRWTKKAIALVTQKKTRVDSWRVGGSNGYI